MSTSRREFLKGATLVGGVGLAGVALPGCARAAAPAPAEKKTAAPMPQRVLGRTGRRVSLVGIGTATLGSGNSSPDDVTRVVKAALAEGINYVDTAPNYGDAEAKLKPVLATERDKLFLVTKVEAQRPARDEIIKQLEESCTRMGVKGVDVAHIHNLGDFDMNVLFAADGTMAGLREAKKRGLIRHIGVSGHSRPHRFVTLIEKGDIDLTMVALNFADRNLYDFEGLVLPVARKQNTAIVAMKVLGGAVDWRQDAKTPGNFAAHYDRAVRYSLGLPSVACAVVGVANENEVRVLAKAARAFKPLPPAERLALLEEGKPLSKARGLYYGPVDG